MVTDPSSAECRFIGNVPVSRVSSCAGPAFSECFYPLHGQTPWPSWAIVATPQTPKGSVKRLLERLDAEVQDFNSPESRENGKDIQYIQKTLGYPEEDIRECRFRDPGLLASAVSFHVRLTLRSSYRAENHRLS